jgi:hypothetical protein
MKAIIFQYQEYEHTTTKLFLHCHDILKIEINTFYRDIKTITFTSISEKIWVQVNVNAHEISFFEEIQEFIQNDEKIKIVKVNKVEKQERSSSHILCYLLDWVSTAINRNKF